MAETQCKPRLAVTTNLTVRADLEASFRQRTQDRIEEVLGEMGHPEDDAHNFACVIARLMEPSRFDALAMLVGDELLKQRKPEEYRRLISQPILTRGTYLRKATRIVGMVYAALEGESEPLLIQAAADLFSHKAAALTREAGRVS